ncbi:MAG: serine protease Do [Rhodothermales bacterium]|jgi:serine protease Do
MRNGLRFTLPVVLVLAGCGQSVQSQQYRPPETSSTGAGDIGASRHNAITRAVETASPAIVSISVVQQIRYQDPFSDPFFNLFFRDQRTRMRERQVQSVGSGFVVSPDGYIVTNDHVAGNGDLITVAFPNGDTFRAELVGTDAASDLALLKVTPEAPLQYLNLDSATSPIVGEWCIALGNPFGLFEAADPTVTVGVVSATGRDLSPQDGRIYRDMIQTDAAINQGNSGGPLLNALGDVIGVNSAIISQSGGSVGIGFAVPIGRVVRVISELKEKGFVDRSYYTGLTGRNVTPRIARALGLTTIEGVFVEDVSPGSPADQAGFLPYDVISAVQDEPIANQTEFVARLYDFRPGDRLRFSVKRDKQTVNLAMRLGSSQEN